MSDADEVRFDGLVDFLLDDLKKARGGKRDKGRRGRQSNAGEQSPSGSKGGGRDRRGQGRRRRRGQGKPNDHSSQKD